MKKILSLIICVVLCLSILPMGSVSANTDIKWTQISETTAQITFYTGMDKSIVIPTTVDGLTVTEISDSAFYGAVIENVTLPANLVSIGKWAFHSSSIKSITIPNTVKEIGSNAFQNCTSLESVTIGSGVTEIPEKAFYGCSSLKTLNIGGSVNNIGLEAFRLCTSLKTLNLPDSVKTVDQHAFADCLSLKTINIGKGLSQIGEYAFCDTTNIAYYGNPTEAEMEVLWKQNVKSDVKIHISNTAAQKHFKSLKKDYIINHITVGKYKKPTISANYKDGTIKVLWSKVKGAKKYTVTLTGAKKKTYTVKKTSLKIKKVVVGKTYKVKVRATFKRAKTSKVLKIKVK